MAPEAESVIYDLSGFEKSEYILASRLVTARPNTMLWPAAYRQQRLRPSGGQGPWPEEHN